MSACVIAPAAGSRIDDIYRFTFDRFGELQADLYVGGMLDEFARIASREVSWTPIHAALGIAGLSRRYGRHIICWRELSGGQVGIMTVLHQSLDIPAHLRDDLA